MRLRAVLLCVGGGSCTRLILSAGERASGAKMPEGAWTGTWTGGEELAHVSAALLVHGAKEDASLRGTLDAGSGPGVRGAGGATAGTMGAL